jgi:hypothetical protein
VVDGVSERTWRNDDRFLSALVAAHPDPHGAWIWRVYRGDDPKLSPYTIGNKYEQLLFVLPQKSLFRCGFADYSIFDPAGRFFLRKGYLDDLRRDAPESKGQFLNPVVALGQLAEAFVVGSQYARTLGYGLGTQLCLVSGYF